MEHIDEYIKRPRAERIAHVREDEPCIERGAGKGRQLEIYRQGLMAHLLDTTIPEGFTPHASNTCKNDNCINPNHHYWGCCEWVETPVVK